MADDFRARWDAEETSAKAKRKGCATWLLIACAVLAVVAVYVVFILCGVKTWI